jgi:hypothetical protein
MMAGFDCRESNGLRKCAVRRDDIGVSVVDKDADEGRPLARLGRELREESIDRALSISERGIGAIATTKSLDF